MAKLTTKIIKYVGQDVNFNSDVILQDDGKGAYIKEWNLNIKKPTDAQLKAVGHPGLWEKGRPEVIDLFEGKDVDGNDIIRPEGQDIRKSIARAGNYPSKSTYLFQRNQMKDGSNFWNPLSVWDVDDNLAPYLERGGGLTGMDYKLELPEYEPGRNPITDKILQRKDPTREQVIAARKQQPWGSI